MTLRVHAEWARRVEAEYGSAAVAAQALAWGVAVGLPPELLRAASRIVSDEIDHAALSHEALIALGGAETPIDLAVSRLVVPPKEGPLPDLLRLIVRDFCLGETLAVPYFAEMRLRATNPAIHAVLERILADEATHRAFGWSALDALIALDAQVPAWVEGHLPAFLASFHGYQAPPDAPPLTDDERGCGLLDNGEYAALFARTLAEDVVPRFGKRGIDCPRWGRRADLRSPCPPP